MQTVYAENQQVQVYDESKRRWYKATTMYIVQYEPVEAWECELRNGNRGDFDIEHMRKV